MEASSEFTLCLINEFQKKDYVYSQTLQVLVLTEYTIWQITDVVTVDIPVEILGIITHFTS